MANVVLPRVQAMVLCDVAHKDENEIGVYRLTGVRTTLEASSFPLLRPRLCAFLQLSGHRGEAHCHVEVSGVETGNLIYHTPRKVIAFDGPLVVVPIAFRIRNCVFPAAGLYYVQAFDQGKLIGERPLRVLQEE